uniref:Uncharacterized protein n=1 Tax=Rhodosorus marinus TaxID=101924 RepID=A0A7S2ZIE2_9RHOD|mmetsp:Transcript_2066/g.8140  ORF Transcript_2066/g.8140 Transcript_2066/m.8140 type:complete len:241 (+) Transcript_2066:3271-3993(+)|eukprot:CAMPEP_0113959470 /NCGR_PEP_ID=MMETSP0011_2-20120614/4162_1 /TAXON_ID=101924 /ORGANISM="Rhodosorus marinus" /LENGTH=240 /DNA_ID=CAMNT_0000970785 /DNA_START=2832 /DNA_END=3554 /DNA_ORIENTATION=- /assembly_acc=CAM_ASM_000156
MELSSDKMEELMKKDSSRRVEEYECLARDTEWMLEQAGVEVQVESSLGGVASIIGADSSTTPHILAALSALFQKSLIAEQMLQDSRRRIREFEDEIRTCALESAKVTAAHTELQGTRAGVMRGTLERKNKTATLRQKTLEYQKNCKHAKSSVLSSGVNTDLTHEAVLNVSEAVLQCQRDVQEYSQRANAYLGLPPDLILAKQKLAEKKQECKDLDEEVAGLMNGITLGGTSARPGLYPSN